MYLDKLEDIPPDCVACAVWDGAESLCAVQRLGSCDELHVTPKGELRIGSLSDKQWSAQPGDCVLLLKNGHLAVLSKWRWH